MTSHDPALTALEELRANVAVPFNAARAMPKSVYTSPEFADAELQHIFAKDWLCAGRAEALPNPGDYLTMQIAGEPIIILRDREGDLARHVQRLPPPDVYPAGRARQCAVHRLPLSCLDL